MKKFEKYLKSAMREKAPDSWDKIEATAKENIPQKEALFDSDGFCKVSRFVYIAAA